MRLEDPDEVKLVKDCPFYTHGEESKMERVEEEIEAEYRFLSWLNGH
jgi:hypothetical protein